MGGDCGRCFHGLKPAAVMVSVQIVFAGANVLFQLAIDDGMSTRILVAYRYIFAAAFLFPFAFFAERKCRPKLSWMIVFQAFCCGFFGGTLVQNLYITSLSMTSVTFASSIGNLIPTMTFIMTVLCRLERLAIRSISGQAKVLGTLVGVSGAMLLTFYKGMEIHPWASKVNLLHNHHASAATTAHEESGKRVMGLLFAVGSCFSYAIWLIIQAKMNEKYPCYYSSIAMMCVMASIQSTIFAMCMDRDISKWKLGWDIRLLSVLYCGSFASGFIVSLMAWCINKRGPLFVSAFNPLMLVILAIVSSLILGERVYIASIVGAVLIITGLYMVLLGKQKEMQTSLQLPDVPVEISLNGNREEEVNNFTSGREGELYSCTIQT